MQWNLSHRDDTPLENNIREPNKPFINTDLIEKIERIERPQLNKEETARLLDDRHYSELDRMFESASERDFIIICMLAVRKHPGTYVNVLLDYILEQEESK